MLSTIALLASAIPFTWASPALVERAAVSPNMATCTQIQSVVSSSSLVSFPGSTTYNSDSTHWVPNVGFNGTCTVQPGTVADIVAIFGVLSSTTTPFAIKSGGHTGSPLFSASSGVTIVMTRFNSIVYHSNNQTADIGPGNVWDAVYDTLGQQGVTVVGGRIQGVGVAGFALGGGYSWITNRYGLSMDNVLAYELVTPTGQVLEVNAQSFPDLFFALKGGMNNYGIVTKFTFKAIPIGQTWGGLINYPASSIPAVEQAVANWAASVTDLDAEIIAAFLGANDTMSSTVLCFYNGATPPTTNNPFAGLLAIPQTSNTLATRSFFDQVIAVSPPYSNPNHMRGSFSGPRVGAITLPIIQTAVQQVEQFTAKPFEPFAQFSVGIEPFLTANILKPNTDGAWPHSVLVSPTTVDAFWNEASNDQVGYNTIAAMDAAINATAATQYSLSNIQLYPNYSIQSLVTLEDMYGPNLAQATSIAAKYDPKKVMTRCGGFIFQTA